LNISGLFGLYGGTFSGNGAINMTGGTIDMPASSTVNWTATGPMSNSGTLNLSNRTITSPITNTGVVNAGSGLTFAQLFSNQGTFNLGGNNVTFSGGYNQSAGTTSFGGGTMSGNAVVTGGTLAGGGNVTGNLSLGGSGFTFGAGDSLTVGGVATIQSGTALALTGGGLSANAVDLYGTLSYSAGTLAPATSFTLRNGSAFTKAGAGTVTIAGMLDEQAGSTLAITGGTLDLAGGANLQGGTYAPAAGSTLRFSGGTVTLNGATTLAGSTELAGGTFAGPGSFDNAGTLGIKGNTTFNVAFNNTGTVTLGNGVTLTALAGYNQTAGSTIFNLASLVGNVALNGGVLSGSGSIFGNLGIGAGRLAVGFSPGSLTVNGDLSLSAASVLDVELGGTAQGSGYDYINVTGVANLDGSLNVTSYGGYVAVAGSTHDFMSFASSAGAFATQALPAGWGMTLDTSAPTFLRLAMAPAPTIPPTTPPTTLPTIPDVPMSALEALMAALNENGGIYMQPGESTMGTTAYEISRVTPDELANSLAQQVSVVTQVIPAAEYEDVKICQ
jgi:hypothetical protein